MIPERTPQSSSGLIRRLKSSLAAKFLLFTILLSVTVFVVMSALTYHLQREEEYQRLQSKSQALADLVASISPDRIFSHDFSSLHQYVKVLSELRDVQYAVILNENGEPLTAYLDNENPVVREAMRAVGSSDIQKVTLAIDLRPDIYTFSSPIRFSDRVIGTVRVGITRQHADQALLNTLLIDVIGTSFLIFCLGFGIYYIFIRQVARPVSHLNQAVKRVAEGELQGRIAHDSEDEIGQLTRSFNEMTAHLVESNEERNQAFDELRELNRTLEMRVQDRTRAIENVNRKLERLAHHDTLTDLPNRTLVLDRMEKALISAERDQSVFVVMLMDLDRFKEVNDTFGHQIGDQLLKKIGERLHETLRDTDTISRLGGDEFAILLPDTSIENGVKVANKLLGVLQQPVEMGDLNFTIGASIGITAYPEHGGDVTTLLRYADVAMYEAKQTKTGFCIYHRDIDTHSPRRMVLMNELRVVVESRSLQLHYQPIVNIETGAIRGVEALARWHHPVKGYIPPDQFIPMIEQTGLIRAFGSWAIDTALAQWAEWRKRGIDIVMSVNLSMRNLHDKQFPDELARLLEKWSVTPHSLLLEITESGMMSDPSHVMKTLKHFNSLGVDISIDDFGTGYSSLSYLKRLPVNEIKIDREFVKDMSHDKDDAVIVRSTIDLAHNLGLGVVAEGVEDEATLMLLKSLNCNSAQGYFFSRPKPAEEVKFVSHKPVDKLSRA